MCILPVSCTLFPFWMIAAGAHIADTLAHEMGHSLFSWIFGKAAFPMIFTLFGASQAAGMTIAFDHNWWVQIAVWGTLAFNAYQFRQRQSNWWLVFTAMLALSLLVFTRFNTVVIAYMGHGGSIMVGGWLLYRAFLYIDARNGFERWLNAFFGCFLILNTMYFSYSLLFDAVSHTDYVNHVAFGITHNDFAVIAEEISSWSVKGIAWFTLGYGSITIVIAFLLAIYRDKEEEDADIEKVY